MGSKILLYARDPGSCNSVAPLVPRLREKGHNVQLYGKDFALPRFREFYGLNPQEWREGSAPLTEAFLAREKPALVVTGASFGDFTERWIWAACGRLGIPAMAILEHWVNYGVRFRDEGGREVFPDRIVVSDAYAAEVATREGLPADRVRLLGNPYYDFLSQWKPAQPGLRARLTPAGEQLVVFASEAFSTAPTNYGYTETEILEATMRALAPLAGEKPVVLLVRPHPKENREKLARAAAGGSGGGLRVVVSAEEHPWELISAADAVVGMISQFLVEAYLLGKPALSVQIGLKGEDPFVLTRQGAAPLVTDPAALEPALRELLAGGAPARDWRVFPPHAIEAVVRELEKLI